MLVGEVVMHLAVVFLQKKHRSFSGFSTIITAGGALSRWIMIINLDNGSYIK